MRAIGASAWLMCTAPVMTSLVGGTCTLRKTRPSGESAGPLLPERSRAWGVARKGSAATSAALTSRCAPLSALVTTIAPRRAARSALRAARMSRRIEVSRAIALVDLLHVHPDGAAAGKSGAPRGLVGDAELEGLRLAALDHVERFGHDVALDASAGDRAEEIALVVDHQVRAHRPRRRAPGLDHGRERNPAPLLLPILGGFENVFLAREHEPVLVGLNAIGFRLNRRPNPLSGLEYGPRRDPRQSPVPRTRSSPHVAASAVANFGFKSGTGIIDLASVLSIPKFASVNAARFGELRNRDTSCQAAWRSQRFGSPPRTPAADNARHSSVMDSRLWIGRNSSTQGSIVRTPLARRS